MLKLDGEEYLWYKAPTINVALLRGTTADVDGNITFEKEAFFGDALNMVCTSRGYLPNSITKICMGVPIGPCKKTNPPSPVQQL